MFLQRPRHRCKKEIGPGLSPQLSMVGGDAFINKLNDETLSKLDGMLSKSRRLQSGLGKFLILQAVLWRLPRQSSVAFV